MEIYFLPSFLTTLQQNNILEHTFHRESCNKKCSEVAVTDSLNQLKSQTVSTKEFCLAVTACDSAKHVHRFQTKTEFHNIGSFNEITDVDTREFQEDVKMGMWPGSHWSCSNTSSPGQVETDDHHQCRCRSRQVSECRLVTPTFEQARPVTELRLTCHFSNWCKLIGIVFFSSYQN